MMPGLGKHGIDQNYAEGFKLWVNSFPQKGGILGCFMAAEYTQVHTKYRSKNPIDVSKL